jgi:beta-galactosidase
MYVPGPWLKRGENQIVVLDLWGPEQPTIAGLAKPILNQLRLNRDITPRRFAMRPALAGIEPVKSGEFVAGSGPQEVKFEKLAHGKYVCLESISALDGGPDAAVAELELLDEAGQAINHDGWSVAFVDSESGADEDGSAENAFDGQAASYWHTAVGSGSGTGGGNGDSTAAGQPHRLILDLGQSKSVSGFRYVPRQGDMGTSGRIKEYRFYVGDRLVKR